jgi:hypothetical protein
VNPIALDLHSLHGDRNRRADRAIYPLGSVAAAEAVPTRFKLGHGVIMDRLVNIAAAAIVTFGAGSAFALPIDVDPKPPVPAKTYCARWTAYLRTFGETPYFEKFVEATYKRYCKEHERGEDGDGDDRRGGVGREHDSRGDK